jgi:regulator of protease activity HflC (stomatin/prohibitin superfamily)
MSPRGTERFHELGHSSHLGPVDLVGLEAKDVELPEGMRRAMGRQAEAERERRSKVIHAEGEREAANSLSEAAIVLDQGPGAMQLRLLSTMAEVAAERNSILIFPVPIELLRFARDLADDHTASPAEPGDDG